MESFRPSLTNAFGPPTLRGTWGRIEAQVPTKVVKDMPKVFVLSDDDYAVLIRRFPLPLDEKGIAWYGKSMVLKESDIFRVDPATLNLGGNR